MVDRIDGSSKIKLLKLYEMLRQETDENHPMSRQKVCDRMNQMGIHCDVRTISTDISTLNKFGFEVMIDYINHEKLYYVSDRAFSVPELRIIIDAIQASGFITKKKTAEIIDKVAALGGSAQAELLKGNLICFNSRKHSNENILFNILSINEALEKKQKLSFKYYDINEKGEKVFRKDGWRYTVEPIITVFNNDNYYLLTYYDKIKQIVNYRIDRMTEVSVETERISDATQNQIANMDIDGYNEQLFKMFGGPCTNVTLQFDKSILGAIYDKFGEDTKIKVIDDDTLAVCEKVQVSPTFFGWIFQFGSKIKIITPKAVLDEFNNLKNQ